MSEIASGRGGDAQIPSAGKGEVLLEVHDSKHTGMIVQCEVL